MCNDVHAFKKNKYFKLIKIIKNISLTNWIYNGLFFYYIRRKANRVKKYPGLDSNQGYPDDIQLGTLYSNQLSRLHRQHTMEYLHKPQLMRQA